MTELDVSHNHLEDLFDVSTKPFEILVLNKNYLRYLPFDMMPPTLKHLSADTNDILTLLIDTPMPELKSISLQKNKITVVEIDFDLPALQSLYLHKNYIRDISFLRSLPNLIHLDISFNEVDTLQYLPSSLVSLKANFCKIRMIQSRLPPGLIEMSLVGNRLKNGSLPLCWGNSLRLLDLSNNQLKEFPKRLPDTLERLILCMNEITSLPKELPSSLKVLNLNKNKLHELPVNMNVRLTLLFASENHLTQEFDENPLYAKHFFGDGNWNQSIHHKSQISMKKCWKRYLLQKRLRHLGRSRRIYEELLMVALHPDRVLQTDTFSPEWFK
jgi:Leucine-rich repeat (LRR) protein